MPPQRALDLHGRTEEQAWDAIVALLDAAGADGNPPENDKTEWTGFHPPRRKKTVKLKIITGASGILKQKFQQWATDSIISHRIISCKPINSGSFEIVVKRGVLCAQ